MRTNSPRNFLCFQRRLRIINRGVYALFPTVVSANLFQKRLERREETHRRFSPIHGDSFRISSQGIDDFYKVV